GVVEIRYGQHKQPPASPSHVRRTAVRENPSTAICRLAGSLVVFATIPATMVNQVGRCAVDQQQLSRGDAVFRVLIGSGDYRGVPPPSLDQKPLASCRLRDIGR